MNSLARYLTLIYFVGLFSLSACTKKNGTEQKPAAGSKGVGPVAELKLEAINPQLAEKGKAIFALKCASCHKFNERFVGPALKGVTQRRQPAWIMNMILNPVEMTQKDETAKSLLSEYLTQMTFQNVTQDEARQILEYFRQMDAYRSP